MSAIQQGDMVQVVFGCCAGTRDQIGDTFVAGYLHDAPVACMLCGYVARGQMFYRCHFGSISCYCPRSWLIKVEPPAKSETTEQVEEVHA